VADTGVAVGTVVAIGSAPVFTGLLASSFAGERLTRGWAGATALGCAGMCTLLLGGGSGGEVSLPGVGLALLAGAGYAGYAVAGYILFARGLERIGAGETATLTLAEPVTAATLGFVVLGERPGAATIAGATLVLAALALLALRPNSPGGVRARPAEAAA
jgi:DME family drug/metabolite transporter